MALMMASLYEALRNAGSSDEQARKAAEEVATYENRFAKIEADLSLLKWMVGFNLAMTTAVLFKLFV
jgi:hypothetical protein